MIELLRETGDQPVSCFAVQGKRTEHGGFTIETSKEFMAVKALGSRATEVATEAAALKSLPHSMSDKRDGRRGLCRERCCFFFLQGWCRFGSRCCFHHSRGPGVGGGPCRFGYLCWGGHWQPGSQGRSSTPFLGRLIGVLEGARYGFIRPFGSLGADVFALPPFPEVGTLVL